MNGASRTKRWVARSLPGVLLVATLVDDPLFGGVIVAARLAFGTVGLLAASGAFVVLSVAMAAATAWALHTEPLRLSPKTRNRITSLQQRRLGRHLIPHPDRPLTTALGAVIFGSVAPILVAALDRDNTTFLPNKMVLVSGIAYGLAFATGYGLLGAIIGAAAT
jgi:hypothetical protein